MTSVPYNVGLSDSTRMSSRVLRPPGGGHTDIFGACEPEPPRKPHAHPQSQIQIGNEEELKKATNGEKAHANPQMEDQENQPEIQQAEASPDESQPDSAPKAEPTKMEPPKRVRVPPGGFSSGLW